MVRIHPQLFCEWSEKHSLLIDRRTCYYDRWLRCWVDWNALTLWKGNICRYYIFWGWIELSFCTFFWSFFHINISIIWIRHEWKQTWDTNIIMLLFVFLLQQHAEKKCHICAFVPIHHHWSWYITVVINHDKSTSTLWLIWWIFSWTNRPNCYYNYGELHWM